MRLEDYRWSPELYGIHQLKVGQHFRWHGNENVYLVMARYSRFKILCRLVAGGNDLNIETRRQRQKDHKFQIPGTSLIFRVSQHSLDLP